MAIRSRALACLLFALLGAPLVLPERLTAQQSAERPGMIYVTRAETAMLLLSSAGIPVPKRTTGGRYPDLIESEWYTSHMLTAFDRGILDPPEFGLAQPHRQVTRAEFLKMLARTFRLPLSLPSTYQDVHRSDWFWSYAGIATRYGLFTSPDTAHLYPNVLVHHFEVSQAIERVLEAHPELRPTPSAALERPVMTAVGTAAHGSAPDAPAVGGSQEYITVSMVKNALIQVLRSNVLIATQTKVDLLDQINVERARNGVPPLTLNTVLTTAAQNHAEDMWKRHYFDHVTPEGRTYVDRIRGLGYLEPRAGQCPCTLTCECLPAFAVGENIAQGQFTVEHVMRDWLNSPAHRENILSPEFRDIGFGLFGTIWVQTFGRVDFVTQYR